MRIFLAQLNSTVGDVVSNATKVRRLWDAAAKQNADLVVCPELSLTGYPLDDLALRPGLQDDVHHTVEALAKETAGGPALLLGAPWKENEFLYNAALLLEDGKIAAKIFKQRLPNYGPFDDQRLFHGGPTSEPVLFRGHKLGIMVCEDMWFPETSHELKRKGAEIFVVLNASPFETGKHEERQALARSRVMENETPLIYVNSIGGQDDLVFDGGSFVVSATGALKIQAPRWQEDLVLTQWNKEQKSFVPETGLLSDIKEDISATYDAIVLGLRDYVRKNKFTDVVLGLSGGIDSALVAALAVEALGSNHVHTVMMPSVYTSKESMDDALAVAHALRCDFHILPIIPAVDAFTNIFTPLFKDAPPDLTQENIQSRCRGLMLMALSNRFNYLVLATGNKSELATGYATLYGDMCGGYAPLKDLYKTDVYKVARYALTRQGAVIPERIFTKAPTAELRPNQTDQDSLPPYELLDEILRGLIERDMSVTALVEHGFDLTLTKRVWMMLQKAEYKRRQGAPGPKVTRRHLTKDRRYPITSGYTGS